MVSLSAAHIEGGKPVEWAAHAPASGGFLALLVGCIGVVYGDIGTSPLYAFKEAVSAAIGQGTVNRAAVLGVLSLIIWSLLIVVTVKYVMLLLAADNDGEGGTMALMALARKAFVGPVPQMTVLGIVGGALFFGDAMITPAISVLSAVEGLKLATPSFEPMVLPLSVGILIALFAAQRRGTAKVASLFGPITVVWFIAIAAIGAIQIAGNPDVLSAFNPLYGVRFLASNGYIGFITLGAVFLAVTGAEALYADLGHFGRRPIRLAWFGLVLPALLINYLGQGALVLADPAAMENPFYRMVPAPLLLPMIALATAATVIASQAVITGAYSLANQAVQLGLLPRMDVRHTSDQHAGQIYMPQINLILLAGVLLLVALFKTSSNLATAYGIAVTGTMLVTTIMAFVVIWKRWNWPLWMVSAVLIPLALIDLIFLGANLQKVAEGGWATMLIAGGFVVVMLTWWRGTKLVADRAKHREVALDDLVHQIEKSPPNSIKGTAIYLTGAPDLAPVALMHSLKHFRALHEKVAILSIRTVGVPRVPVEQAVQVTQLSDRFSEIDVTIGFMQTPNVPLYLEAARAQGWQSDMLSTSFMLSRRSFKPEPATKMPLWQERLFIGLANSAFDATEYFQIPRDRVVEIGTQVGI